MQNTEEVQLGLRPPNLKIVSVQDMLLIKDLDDPSTISESDEISPFSGQKFRVCQDIFQKKYEIGENIGEGANGVVNVCHNRETGLKYAVKIMRLDDEYSQFLKKNYLNVRCLRHPNLILYKGLFLQNQMGKSYLLMEYKNFPQLSDIVNLNDEELNIITKQILSALAYLHSSKFIHRDIKPDNILYDPQTKKVVIIDFGVGKKISNSENEKTLSITGAPRYRAPQMNWLKGYGEKVDLWSLGISLYELVCKKVPFQSLPGKSPDIKELSKKIAFEENVWSNFSPHLRDLITRLLVVSPQKRLSAKEALEHLWFKTDKKEIEVKYRNCQSSKEQSVFPLAPIKTFNNYEEPTKLFNEQFQIESDEEGINEDQRM